MGLLDSPLVRKYFGCDNIGCIMLGESIEKFKIFHMSRRVLLSMEQPIKKGDKVIMTWVKDMNPDYFGISVSDAPHDVSDVFHAGVLRLPDKFQPPAKKGCEFDPAFTEKMQDFRWCGFDQAQMRSMRDFAISEGWQPKPTPERGEGKPCSDINCGTNHIVGKPVDQGKYCFGNHPSNCSCSPNGYQPSPTEQSEKQGKYEWQSCGHCKLCGNIGPEEHECKQSEQGKCRACGINYDAMLYCENCKGKKKLLLPREVEAKIHDIQAFFKAADIRASHAQNHLLDELRALCNLMRDGK